MRLVSLARFKYGLLWPGKLPRIDWRLLVDAMALLIILFFAYAVVGYNDQEETLKHRAATAVQGQARAEKALAHCFNGGSFEASDGSVVMCDKLYVVRM